MDWLRLCYNNHTTVNHRFYRSLFLQSELFHINGTYCCSTTDPPALAYANMTAGNDAPAVGYATVYPLTMFLRVLTAQLLILFFV